MSEYYVADMTLEEKGQFIQLQSPGSTYDPANIRYGVSLFDGNNRWLGGIVLEEKFGPHVTLAVIPDIQGTGLWIQCIPILFGKMFEQTGVFYIITDDPSIQNIVRKFGPVDITEDFRGGERVYFYKEYTMAHLGTTVNSDFMSKTELPPKALSTYTTVTENGTETFKTLFVN